MTPETKANTLAAPQITRADVERVARERNQSLLSVLTELQGVAAKLGQHNEALLETICAIKSEVIAEQRVAEPVTALDTFHNRMIEREAARARPVRPKTGRLQYSFPGGKVVTLDLEARFEVAPAHVDDGQGAVVIGQTDTGFIVFVEGGSIPAECGASDYVIYPTRADAYAFALDVVRVVVAEWLAVCDECDAEVQS